MDPTVYRRMGMRVLFIARRICYLSSGQIPHVYDASRPPSSSGESASQSSSVNDERKAAERAYARELMRFANAAKHARQLYDADPIMTISTPWHGDV